MDIIWSCNIGHYVLETHQHDHTPVEDSSVVAVAAIGAEQRLLQLVAAEETDKMSQAVANDMFSTINMHLLV